jgi:hypothetical protein
MDSKDSKNNKEIIKENRECNTTGIDSIVSQAMRFMSPEELERYKNLGKEFYGAVDFENSEILNNKSAPEEIDSIIYSLKSGLLPSMLEKVEQELMEKTYGKEWYKNFGYDEFE